MFLRKKRTHFISSYSHINVFMHIQGLWSLTESELETIVTKVSKMILSLTSLSTLREAVISLDFVTNTVG